MTRRLARPARRWIIATILAGALAAAGACDDTQQPTPTAPTAPTTPTTPTTTPQAGEWRGLTIAPEDRCSPYDADDYRYPQSVEDDIVRDLGGIYSPYTCETFDSDTQTDIEHIIARSEAHDSGLCGADDATRTQFARDLLNLTLASPSLNRSQKSDKDAAEWMPDQNRCWFAQTIVDVRLKYGLTIDQAEADAIDRMLGAVRPSRSRAASPRSGREKASPVFVVGSAPRRPCLVPNAEGYESFPDRGLVRPRVPEDPVGEVLECSGRGVAIPLQDVS